MLHVVEGRALYMVGEKFTGVHHLNAVFHCGKIVDLVDSVAMLIFAFDEVNTSGFGL